MADHPSTARPPPKAPCGSGRASFFRRWLAAALLFAAWPLLPPSPAVAAALPLTNIPAESLGVQTQYLIEQGQPLSLAQAMARYRDGEFRAGQESILNFGIGSRPVWLHLEVNNPTPTPLSFYLVAGVTWLDRLDVYVARNGKTEAEIHTGDETPGARGVTPALGYALPLQFQPGRSDIYLRVDSVDPMPLPIQLMTDWQLSANKLFFAHVYGFLYGFLAALCAYNLLLFAGIGERSYLYYSLALVSIILGNIAYTGHGLAGIWPNHLLFQRYVILTVMVVYSSFGLLFASRFLALEEHAPKALKAVRWFSGLGLGAMALALLTDSHLAATLVAFLFMSLFTVGMLLLGILAVRQGRTSGRYFLAATVFGLIGAASTVLAVWGKIPFTPETFHALEVGLLAEATLLAMALAYKIRQYQQANLDAKRMARQDPLTGLYNRRGFMELAEPLWNAAEGGGRPLSIVVMDIDHFKQVNDRHGHLVGDEALRQVARVLKRHGRKSDVVARWGGEEFILLLMETTLRQAHRHAEELRQAVAEIRLPTGNGELSLTASFGVAERTPGTSFDAVVRNADSRLYEAKRAGRNRVSSAPPANDTLAAEAPTADS
ncbi:MAG: diguanylate cyclase [Sulfuricellaceae bacterium]